MFKRLNAIFLLIMNRLIFLSFNTYLEQLLRTFEVLVVTDGGLLFFASKGQQGMSFYCS